MNELDSACLNIGLGLSMLPFLARGFIGWGFEPYQKPQVNVVLDALDGNITMISYPAAAIFGLLRAVPEGFNLANYITRTLTPSESLTVSMAAYGLAVVAVVGSVVVGAAGPPVAAYLLGRAGGWIANSKVR